MSLDPVGVGVLLQVVVQYALDVVILGSDLVLAHIPLQDGPDLVQVAGVDQELVQVLVEGHHDLLLVHVERAGPLRVADGHDDLVRQLGWRHVLAVAGHLLQPLLSRLVGDGHRFSLRVSQRVISHSFPTGVFLTVEVSKLKVRVTCITPQEAHGFDFWSTLGADIDFMTTPVGVIQIVFAATDEATVLNVLPRLVLLTLKKS